MTNALTTSTTAAVNIGDQYTSTTDAQVVTMFLHGRSDNTKRKYERDLQSFFVWLDGRSFRSVTLPDLQDWSSSLTGAPKSIRERIATVRSFFQWSTRLGVLRMNPAALLQQPKVRGAMHERIMTETELQSILQSTTSERDRVLLLFLFVSGVRVSELVALSVKDLRFADDGSCTVSIYRQKTNSTTVQRHALPDLTSGLRTLVDGRRSDDAVFRSSGVPATIATRAGNNVDGRLDASAVWRIVRAAAKRAGITKSVSTHWLRHSCGSRLARRGANAADIANWLGHSSVQTAMTYIHVENALDLSHHFA